MSKHTQRGRHRAAAFSFMNRITASAFDLAMHYASPAEAKELKEKWDKLDKISALMVRDRHPETLEKLDGE